MEPKNKLTVFTSKEFVSAVENRYLRSNKIPATFLDSPKETFTSNLMFRKFHPFFEVFNKKLDLMISSGIIQHWRSTYINPTLYTKKEDAVPARILTMDECGIGFLICLASAFISLIVFCIECFTPVFKRSCKHCFELFIAVNIVKYFISKKTVY